MPGDTQIGTIRFEVAKLAQEMKDRIPHWIPLIPVEFSPTVIYGVIGKCSNYTEELLKRALWLMKYPSNPAQAQLVSAVEIDQIDKLTLGEVCRLIKAQQKTSWVFQGVEKSTIGRTFTLLEQIVRLRNKLVHLKHDRMFSLTAEGEERKKAEAELHTLLDCVFELCNSWLINKLLDESG
jgi:hypothetical protein